MVNPLPLQRLNRQNVGQKLQELLQFLLNHPLKVVVTLVISRGLWIPLLKRLAKVGFVGLSVVLRIVFYPLEFAISKLPVRQQDFVVEYLTDTFEILILPFHWAFRLVAELVKNQPNFLPIVIQT